MLVQTITPQASNQNPITNDLFNAVFPRSANFRIELDFDAVIDFIQQIGDWNDFSPGRVIDALEAADRLIPRCSRSGDRTYNISVGREGSPILYLERDEYPWSKRLSESAIRAICQEMELMAHADDAHCDIRDFAYSKGRHIEFRFWWD